MGRPTKINADRQHRAVEAILHGGSNENAARNAGINPATLYDWSARGRKALAAARADGKTETIPDAPTTETDHAAVLRVARATAKIVPVVDRPYAEFSEAIDAASTIWELGQVQVIHSAAIGTPYERRRVKTEQRIVDGERLTLVTETVETGTTFDWRAALALLRVRKPQVYNETIRMAHTLDDEQTGLMLATAVERILDELGVDRRRKGVGAVVHRHLMLVADEAEANAS